MDVIGDIPSQELQSEPSVLPQQPRVGSLFEAAILDALRQRVLLHSDLPGGVWVHHPGELSRGYGGSYIFLSQASPFSVFRLPSIIFVCVLLVVG